MIYRIYTWYLYLTVMVWFAGIADNLFFHAMKRDKLLALATLMFLPVIVYRTVVNFYLLQREEQ